MYHHYNGEAKPGQTITNISTISTMNSQNQDQTAVSAQGAPFCFWIDILHTQDFDYVGPPAELRSLSNHFNAER